MRLGLLLTFVVLSACGPNRDTSFTRIVQFSAVGKLVVAGDHVYFNEMGGLKRVPKKGGAIEVVTSTSVIDYAATAGHVYAATPSGVLHFALSSSGAVASMSTLSNDAPLAIAADANGVSWVTCSALNNAALDGSGLSTTTFSAPCANNATRLTLDSSTVYGISGQGQWYASRSGGALVKLANEKCSRIEAAGGWLYCSDQAEGLRRFSPWTNDIEMVLAGQVHTFAIGESRIYAGIGQDLVASPRNTSTQDVYGTYAAISAIALDGSDVYFVNTEGNLGLLLRTAQ